MFCFKYAGTDCDCDWLVVVFVFSLSVFVFVACFELPTSNFQLQYMHLYIVMEVYMQVLCYSIYRISYIVYRLSYRSIQKRIRLSLMKEAETNNLEARHYPEP